MNVTLCMYVDVKPVVTIAASMDLHAMGGGYYLTGGTIAYNAVFWRGYYSRGLLNEGNIYLRKYSMCIHLRLINVLKNYTASTICS